MGYKIRPIFPEGIIYTSKLLSWLDFEGVTGRIN